MSSRVSGVSREPPSRAELPLPWLPWLGAGFLAIALQSSVPLLSPAALRISVTGLMVFFFGFAGGSVRGAVYGAALGLGEDALAASALGWTFANAGAGALAGLFGRSTIAQSFALTACAAALCAFARLELHALVRAIVSPAVIMPSRAAAVALETALSGLVAAFALTAGSRFRAWRGDA